MSGPTSALVTFVSGAQGYSSRFGNHAQNAANAGVPTAKKREVFLSSLISDSSPSNFTPAGIQGKSVASIRQSGAVRPVKYPTFLAVKNSNAFFVVNDNSNNDNPGKFSITRLGTFKEDFEGNLKNSAGQYLKGVYTDATGAPSIAAVSNFSQLSTINVKNLSSSPVSTSTIKYNSDLPGIAPVYQAGPPSVGEYEIGVKVFDSLGIEQDVSLMCRRQPNNVAYPNAQVWNFSIQSPSATGVNAISAPYDAGFDIVFDGSGKPALINGGVPLPPLTVEWDNPATNASIINLQLGDIGKENGLTAAGKLFNRKEVTTDGRPSGVPQNITFDQDGYGEVTFTNGAREKFCRLPFATVNNVDGLTEITGNTYEQSQESGGYSFYFPNENGIGPLMPSSLEDSTINTAEIFTEMIVDSNRFTSCLKGISSVQKLLDALDRINP
jgi:flagellar hook protein FlgE